MECWYLKVIKGPTKFHSYFCNFNFVSLHSWWFETKKSTCYFRQWQGSANNGSQEESFMARRGRGEDRKKREKQEKRPTVSANVKEEDALPPKKFRLAGFKTSFEGCRLSFASLHSPVKRINQPQLKTFYHRNPKTRQPN